MQGRVSATRIFQWCRRSMGVTMSMAWMGVVVLVTTIIINNRSLWWLIDYLHRVTIIRGNCRYSTLKIMFDFSRNSPIYAFQLLRFSIKFTNNKAPLFKWMIRSPKQYPFRIVPSLRTRNWTVISTREVMIKLMTQMKRMRVTSSK
jgi:hypothetical protein